mmetsp:Transcript_66222/g.113861  ORF Transcript_66222/g.113861 Transcript_66222/m.113861 type:complete len:415 (+) Transcript_66222:30-1274(+)
MGPRSATTTTTTDDDDDDDEYAKGNSDDDYTDDDGDEVDDEGEEQEKGGAFSANNKDGGDGDGGTDKEEHKEGGKPAENKVNDGVQVQDDDNIGSDSKATATTTVRKNGAAAVAGARVVALAKEMAADQQRGEQAKGAASKRARRRQEQWHKQKGEKQESDVVARLTAEAEARLKRCELRGAMSAELELRKCTFEPDLTGAKLYYRKQQQKRRVREDNRAGFQKSGSRRFTASASPSREYAAAREAAWRVEEDEIVRRATLKYRSRLFSRTANQNQVNTAGIFGSAKAPAPALPPQPPPAPPQPESGNGPVLVSKGVACGGGDDLNSARGEQGDELDRRIEKEAGTSCNDRGGGNSSDGAHTLPLGKSVDGNVNPFTLAAFIEVEDAAAVLDTSEEAVAARFDAWERGVKGLLS